MRHKPEMVGNARVADKHHSRGRLGDQTTGQRDNGLKGRSDHHCSIRIARFWPSSFKRFCRRKKAGRVFSHRL